MSDSVSIVRMKTNGWCALCRVELYEREHLSPNGNRLYKTAKMLSPYFYRSKNHLSAEAVFSNDSKLLGWPTL